LVWHVALIALFRMFIPRRGKNKTNNAIIILSGLTLYVRARIMCKLKFYFENDTFAISSEGPRCTEK